jgi:hypothetical protein
MCVTESPSRIIPKSWIGELLITEGSAFANESEKTKTKKIEYATRVPHRMTLDMETTSRIQIPALGLNPTTPDQLLLLTSKDIGIFEKLG